MRDSESQSQKPLFVWMANHCRTVYPHMYTFLAGLVCVAMRLLLERRRSFLATLENLSTRTKHLDSPRKPYLSSSHPRPDSLTNRSHLLRRFGPLPVPFGKSWASDLCLTPFSLMQTVSPRSKLKSSAFYLPNGGESGVEEENGLTKTVNLMWKERPRARIALGGPGRSGLATPSRSLGLRRAWRLCRRTREGHSRKCFDRCWSSGRRTELQHSRYYIQHG